MRRTFGHRDAGEGAVSESRHPFAVRLDIAVKYRSAVSGPLSTESIYFYAAVSSMDAPLIASGFDG